MTKESILREKYGIGKPEIKALREQAPEGSWIRDISNKPEKLWGWLWSEEGVKWLDTKLGVKVAPELKDDEEIECRVTRSNFVNRRLIEIERDGVKVMARCRDNSLIKPRTIVKVRFKGGFACVTAITKKHLLNNYTDHGKNI